MPGQDEQFIKEQVRIAERNARVPDVNVLAREYSERVRKDLGPRLYKGVQQEGRDPGEFIDTNDALGDAYAKAGALEPLDWVVDASHRAADRAESQGLDPQRVKHVWSETYDRLLDSNTFQRLDRVREQVRSIAQRHRYTATRIPHKGRERVDKPDLMDSDLSDALEEKPKRKRKRASKDPFGRFQ